MIAVCNTSPTLVAAFELLVALCAGCIENLQYVANALTELYYSGTRIIFLLQCMQYRRLQWEFGG